MVRGRREDEDVQQERSDDDEALRSALRACARGDEAGIDEILRLEGGRLHGVARRMLGRAELAEEAVQDAMVQIWRKAGQAGGGSARGWIYAVLRNRCRNILRDGRRLSVLAPEDIAAMQDARQAAAPEEGWQILPGSSRLRDCLAGLDARSRRAILLAHVGGFSHGEIAGMQNVPVGTAKSWIRRGLAALRECLS